MADAAPGGDGKSGIIKHARDGARGHEPILEANRALAAAKNSDAKPKTRAKGGRRRGR